MTIASSLGRLWQRPFGEQEVAFLQRVELEVILALLAFELRGLLILQLLKVLRDELDLDVSKSAGVPARLVGRPAAKIEYLLDSDVGASVASGSYPVDGMVVIPCTTGCLAQIASGISSTLIERAADVCLKEGRKLILALRDTPLSRVHLENMLRAQAAGALIYPVIPSFYHRPRTIDDLVTQYCCRVLTHLGLEHRDQPVQG